MPLEIIAILLPLFIILGANALLAWLSLPQFLIPFVAVASSDDGDSDPMDTASSAGDPMSVSDGQGQPSSAGDPMSVSYGRPMSIDGHPQSEGSVGSNGAPSGREEVSRASSSNSNARRQLQDRVIEEITRLLGREGQESQTSLDAISDVMKLHIKTEQQLLAIHSQLQIEGTKSCWYVETVKRQSTLDPLEEE